MYENLNDESKKAQISLIIIWATMAMALFVYLLVCYMVLETNSMEFMKTPEFLDEVFIAGLSYKLLAYLSSTLIFIVAYMYSKNLYNKIVQQTQSENIIDIDEEFKSFRTKYTTIMFISLASYETIAILGIVIFLTTGDIVTFGVLVLTAFVGFTTVMPTRNRLNYKKEFIN